MLESLALDITCTSGNYKDAETSFRAYYLLTITTIPFRGWGSPEAVRPTGKQPSSGSRGPCRLCSAMGALSSPVPKASGRNVLSQDGDGKKAKGSFVAALSMGEEGNPEHDAARQSRPCSPFSNKPRSEVPMPNSIDSGRPEIKFMPELAGGVGANVFRRPSKGPAEITLPDLPSSSPSASSHLQTCRGWPRPRRRALIETLAQMISNETRTQATKDGVAYFYRRQGKRARRDQREEAGRDHGSPRLHEIQRYPRYFQDFQLGRRDFGAIASVATIVAGAATESYSHCGGAVMPTMAINSAEHDTDGGSTSKMLINAGPPD